MNSVEALDFAIGKIAPLAEHRHHGADSEPCGAARPILECVETLRALRELIAERRPFEMASLEAAMDDYGREPFAGKTVDAWLR